jgi:hypothetical protein
MASANYVSVLRKSSVRGENLIENDRRKRQRAEEKKQQSGCAMEEVEYVD